jgi:hypothetical protein
MAVENRGRFSTVVEDTPTICWVCKLSGVPYIVVISRRKMLVAPLLVRKVSQGGRQSGKRQIKEKEKPWKLLL